MRDRELMERIASGDAESLALLYDRYSSRVLGLVRLIVRDRHVAEDVLQEVFWQVWTKRADYQVQRASVRSWLFMIARSRSIDALRRLDSLRMEASLEQMPNLARLNRSLSEWEAAFDLAGPLQKLPAEEREVVVRSYLVGMTHQEIARETGHPLGTVKSRIRSGIRRLGEVFARTAEKDEL